MNALPLDELRNLVAHLTNLGARAVWDGEDRVDSIAMFGTKVTDRDLENLRMLPGLRQVNLTRTGVSDAGMFYLSKLQSLEVLLLGGADVTDEGIELLSSLTNLRQLNLNSTNVSDRSMPYLSRMSRLEFLWLERTDISDAGLDAIAELESLQLLDLCRSPITDSGLAKLKGLTNLEELNLAGCVELTGDALAGLTKLKRLEWLGLDCTGVDAEGVRHITGLPLQSLSLNWTYVTDAVFAHLERISTLTELNLLGTRIESESVAGFRDARPDCVVSHSPDLSRT